jgi:hypothetical protein
MGYGYGGILGLIVLILDIIAIVKLLGGSADATHKLIWVLVILFLPLIGMILYFLIGESRRDA